MPDTPCPTCKTPVPGGALFCPSCGSRTGMGDSRGIPEPVVDIQGRLARALGPKYEVRRLLGEGGFAQVYEVFDTDLQRRLAVKVLKPDIAWSSGMLERFRQECRSIARLSHPNILAIHFVGEGEGLVYYAMPFVEGDALSTVLRKSGALSVDRALAIVRPLLDALAHAHSQGLIHRDIKPDNIMLEASTGRPLLVDFGIAKRIDGEGHKTQTGFVVGTPQYMSPEQALGQGDLDARSDIYAVGAVLYQMVTGTPPFEGESSQEIVGKHLSEPPPIATAKNAKIPMWLSDIIARCLAKRPAERFQSAAMLLDALNAGRESGAQQPVSAERIAAKLKSDEATVMLPSSERARTAPSAAATVATGAAARPAPPPAPTPGRGRLALLVVLLLAGAGAAWLMLGKPPVLAIDNRLTEPIKVVVGTETFEVPAEGHAEHTLRSKGPLAAQWYLVRPNGPGGKPLGVEMQGSITTPAPKGTVAVEVGAQSGEKAVFAPLVTNTTDQALTITVNAGTVNAISCECSVSPGATRAHIGYYPLFLNSTLQAATPTGAVATFRDLGPQVDRTTGTVGLRFEAKDFPK
jgi:serine/threonine-protein kinase